MKRFYSILIKLVHEKKWQAMIDSEGSIVLSHEECQRLYCPITAVTRFETGYYESRTNVWDAVKEINLRPDDAERIISATANRSNPLIRKELLSCLGIS